MKPKFYFNIFLLGLICLVSCNKEKPEPEKDYREKWIGSYGCEKGVSSTRTNPITGESFTCDTIYQVVEKVIKEQDSLIKLLGISVKIDTKGVFGIHYPETSCRSFYGYFRNDSIYVFQYHCGGLGAWTDKQLKGKKIKSNK